MAEETPETPDLPERLQQIVVGLRQLERKCRTLADRHPDFPEIARRLGELAEAISHRHREVDFADAARSVEPAVTLFETAGFMTVAREAGRLRNLLAEEAPEHIDEVTVGSRRIFSASTARRDEEGGGSVVVDVDAEMARRASMGPSKIIFALIALLLVVTVATGWIVHRRLQAMETARNSRIAAAAVTPTPTPTPRPIEPTPTRVPLDADGLARAKEFADSIAAARLALVAGDHPAAIENLWMAARIDREHASTMAVAERILEALVLRSEHEISRGLWVEAETTLDTARDLAASFGRDATAIEAASRRHAALPRFVLVNPGDTGEIERWAGHRADITLVSGRAASGTIKRVEAGLLLLDQSSRLEQGRGAILYVEQVELGAIRQIKVWMK